MDKNENEILLFNEIKNKIDKYEPKSIFGRVYFHIIELSKEEFNIWLKFKGKSDNQIYCKEGGEYTHYLIKKFSDNQIGIYTPRKGYYSIVEIPQFPIVANTGYSLDGLLHSDNYENTKTINGDNRVIAKPIYAKFDLIGPSDFMNEIVLIDIKPLFNKNSRGPKDISLKEGLIIWVDKSPQIIDGAYSISWKVLDSNGNQLVSDDDNFIDDNFDKSTYNKYRGSYTQDIEGWSDQDIDNVFDGNPDAYWNID